ncbi:uncharacterized protein A1O5_09502 [Cladophialophora psammophila CBS 110553]|uniref:FAD-binding domain-containing protein n=1 Tax=Cladophialophora psammophila CBS 110553 TaxID=1182543 RepID=W9XAM0_9EURO|nr:uncharacterized protein A1O5_09502 [Cladophialophora psammophila CBS 110553]EXJ67489.1 hypothetical protein A1O5_09502 [Cladophialophora psammophila CBS 110553]
MREYVPSSFDTNALAAKTRALNVLVIGAGLGGLTTAIALRRAGHNVTVFEKSRLASEFGAAINVPPNANGILLHLGIDATAAGAVEFKWFTEYSKTGDYVRVNDFAQRSRGWQHKYLLAHRVDLHTQLKDTATSSKGLGPPVELKTASEVVDVDINNGTITLKDGSNTQGDLVVAADGIHSRCRSKLTDQRPNPSGHLAYRFMIKKADALAIPELVDVVEKTGELVFWFDVDRRIVMYPTRNDSILNFVCIHPDQGTVGLDDTWNGQGNREDLIKTYEGFDPRALRLLGMVDESTLKVWRLMDMGPIEKWYAERFCLVGDAAHPFLPHQGQGGAQAMEDGVSLGTLLPRGTDPSEVPARLKLYQRCRKERAEFVQEVTRQSGKNIEPGQKNNIAKVMKFFDYNCGHDEYHHSLNELRKYQFKEQAKVYWRMPISFGPYPGPRQDAQGHIRETSHSNFITRSIRFKTSRTLLQNFLPTTAYTFLSGDTIAEASYIQTTLDNMDWLGGRGYNYFGFYMHGIQYKKKDGETVVGNYLAVMWEDLTDPILSGREEVGFPKLFADIAVEHTASTYSMQASWRGAGFLKLELNDLVACEACPPTSEDQVFTYKYVPSTGNPGFADAEYPICVPTPSAKEIKSFLQTSKCNISTNAHDWKALPTLHHIVSRLSELPVYEVVKGTVSEGTGVDSLASAYRIE